MKKLVSLFSVVALIAGVIAFTTPSAKALAPTGTLTGAVVTVQNGQTIATPVLTVTDAAAAEITAANDIRIQIPAGVQATWDTTVLAPTFGGTELAKVDAAVTYPDTKTLLINVTVNFANSGTLTITGLQYIGTGSSVATALDWAIDGAVPTYGAANANTNITAVNITLTGAIQTVDIGQIAAINAMTVADDANTAQITLGNDVRIRIPAGVNAVWDVDDVTATIAGTAVAKVSTTVSYADVGKTLILNVTGDLAATETIIVSDLSFIGTTAASVAAALTYSYDGGVTYFNGNVNTNVTVANGVEDTLTSITVTPTSAVVGTQTTHALAFTIPATGVLPDDGQIVITFPAGFTVATAAVTGVTGIDGAFAIALASPAVTLTRDDTGANTTAGAKTLTVNLITNHATANSTYTVTVRTNTAAGELLAQGTSTAFLINPAAITTLSCLGSSAPGSVYLTWTVSAGTTASYVARYSTAVISTENLFNAATDFATAAGWTNGTVGQSVGAQLVTGLSPGGTYFFNVKAKGAGTSLSAISNASTACAATTGASSTASTTTSSPTSSITSPASGTTSAAETAITISGVSSDNGVSSIKKVEVSTDGGTTWAEALALTANSDYGFSWTYAWTLPAEGPHTIKTRATNWVGVVETPGAGITVTVAPKAGIVYVPASQLPAAGTPATSGLPYASPVGATQITANITYLQGQLLTLLQQLVALLQTQLQALGH